MIAAVAAPPITTTGFRRMGGRGVVGLAPAAAESVVGGAAEAGEWRTAGEPGVEPVA